MLWWWRGEWVKEGWLPGSLRVVARLQGRDSEDLGSWGGGTEEGGSRAGTCPKLEGSPLKFRSDWVYWEKEDAFEKHKSLLTLLDTIGLGCFQGVEPRKGVYLMFTALTSNVMLSSIFSYRGRWKALRRRDGWEEAAEHCLWISVPPRGSQKVKSQHSLCAPSLRCSLGSCTFSNSFAVSMVAV